MPATRPGQRRPPPRARWRRKLKAAASFPRLIWAGLVAISVALTVITAAIEYQARDRAVEAASGAAENLVIVLEKHAATKLEALDLVLSGLLAQADTLSRREASTEAAGMVVPSLLRRLPYLRALKLIDRTTRSVVFALGEGAGTLTAIDEDVLASENGDGKPARLVSRPLDDGAGEWLVAMSRSIGAGHHLTAVAHLDLRHFQSLFDEIDVGRGGSIALFRDDGVLLVRKPYDRALVGRSFADARLVQEVPRAAAGRYETISVTDGVRRIFAYRHLPAAGLVITAGLARDEVLAPWRDDLVRNLTFIPCVIAMLVLFGALLSREARRRALIEGQARSKSALLEATLDNMDQGLMMIDAAARVQVCNRRALQLLELPPALFAGQPRFEDVIRYQFERGEFANTLPQFQQWAAGRGLEARHHAYERERPNGTVLEIRTVPLAGGGAVRTFMDITERKRAEERVAHAARHDPLTGLPNRLLFREKMEQALAAATRRGAQAAVLCVDLDHFKPVNDALGHAVGDALLIEVAARIACRLGPADTVARLGGDEFMILQVGAEQPASARALAEALVTAIDHVFLLDGQRVHVGASIGIALAPRDGLDPDRLLRCADLALYRAKSEGRGACRIFEPAMEAEIDARRSLELDLRHTLETGGFALHYQPLTRLHGGGVAGFEALLRWPHPRRGAISPAEFVPLAEETGLIVPLGRWVLREACREAAAWPAGMRVSVNVSAAQFRSRDLVETVRSALAEAGIGPDRLELEITESVLMAEVDASLDTLHRLREMGVRIALDDFGTGYSSLSYLRSFPFDRIKIDRSFIRQLSTDPQSSAIVRTIVSLGASLDIPITAEGIETEAQLDFVRAAGCAEAQGYFLGAPKPACELRPLLGLPRAAA